MAQAGVQGVSPKHPDVLALIGAGVAPELFGDAATKAVAKGKGFQYVVGTLRSQLAEAGGHGSGAPPGPARWDADRSSIEAEGVRVGIGQWCGNAAQELFSAYTERVRLAREASAVAA